MSESEAYESNDYDSEDDALIKHRPIIEPLVPLAISSQKGFLEMFPEDGDEPALPDEPKFLPLWRAPHLNQQWKADGRNSADVQRSTRSVTFDELFVNFLLVEGLDEISSITVNSEYSLDLLFDFLAILTPLLWHWVLYNQYFNRFGMNDLFHVALTLVNAMMLVMLNYGIEACYTMNVDGEYRCGIYAISMASLRSLLLLSHLRVAWAIPKTRKFVTYATVNFIVNIGLWLFIAAAHLYNSVWLETIWWCIVGIDIAFFIIPIRIKSYRKEYLPLNVALFDNRLSMLVLVAVGYAITASASLSVRTVPDKPWAHFASLVLAAFLAYMLKMTYFDGGQEVGDRTASHAMRSGVARGQLYVMFHLPFIGSNMLLGAMLFKVVDKLALTQPERILFCCLAAMVLFSFCIIQVTHRGSGKKVRVISKELRLGFKLFCIIPIVGLGFIPEDNMPLWALMLTLDGILFLTVCVDVLGKQVLARLRARVDGLKSKKMKAVATDTYIYDSVTPATYDSVNVAYQ